MSGNDGPASTDLAGRTVLAGRYELGEALGRGGMATVYRAWDSKLGREVAVKVFGPAGAPGDGGERRLREVRLLAATSHPHLVTLFDADWPAASAVESSAAASATGPEPRQPGFLVMELVEGESLRRHIDRIGPDGELARRTLIELSGALGHLHEHGIVHRDLKPENILVDAASGGLKLVDFGIAQLIGDEGLTATGAVLGTAAYLSPEQVAGRPVGTATDVYALGLVALEVLTGRRAFPGAAVESAVARMTRDPEVPSSLPREWRELLAAMTAREPEERPLAAAIAAGAAALGVPAVADAASELPTAPMPAHEFGNPLAERPADGLAAGLVAGHVNRVTADTAATDAVTPDATGVETVGLVGLPIGPPATAEGRTVTAGQIASAASGGSASALAGAVGAGSARPAAPRSHRGRERGGALAAAGATLLVASGALAFALSSGHASDAGADPTTPAVQSSPVPTVTEQARVPQPAVTQTVQPAPVAVQTTTDGARPAGPAGGPATGNGPASGSAPVSGPVSGPGAGHGNGHGKSAGAGNGRGPAG